MIAYEPTEDDITKRLSPEDLPQETADEADRRLAMFAAKSELRRTVEAAEHHEGMAALAQDQVARSIHSELAEGYRAIAALCSGWLSQMEGSV